MTYIFSVKSGENVIFINTEKYENYTISEYVRPENDSYYTIQLLGSFKELLKYNKNEKEEEINDLPKGKTIIISDVLFWIIMR